MGMITSIRAPFPVAEIPLPPAIAPRLLGGTGAGAPIAATLLDQAVQHVAAKPASANPQFIAAQASVEHSATAAAEAARMAYIKASFAAGISPLPLP